MSGLLPTSHTQFQLKDYWEKFFQKRSSPFEWYGEYLDLCHILHKYMKQQNKILMVGCGNSKLSDELYDAGFQKIENVDISEVVIRQMSSKNKERRPLMNYHVMDMLEMTFEDSSFDCIIDKGTLDAICVNGQLETMRKVSSMFSEVKRVLKTGGRYICVSLSQEHVLKQLLDGHSEGWIVRAHVIRKMEEGVAGSLPVFAFVMTKMMSIPGQLLAQYFTEDDKCVRCEKSQDLIEFVQSQQQYVLLQHHLNSLHLDEQITVNLWSSENTSEPRYTLRIVDLPRKKATNGLFAIFLVPQGRETNWLFSCDSGCLQLAESAGYERLIIVTFHRGHAYPGLDRVKEEVSSKAMELCQEGLPGKKKWPVLTLADGLGSRSILMEDTSLYSGNFIVEESKDEDGKGWIRRLVFLDTPHLAQTELLMKPVRESSKKSKSGRLKPVPSGSHNLVFDRSDLLFPHHRVMTASIALINNDDVLNGREMMKVLIVGLGGGALPMFIERHLPKVTQDVVELDPKLVEVAVKWFGFEHSSNSAAADKGPMINVVVDDGVSHIVSLAKKCQGIYHAIMLDVDNKDPSSGLSSPPLSFITPHFLNSLISLLHLDGIFVSNLSARNKDIEKSVFGNICSYFPLVLRATVPAYVHDIIVGFPSWREDIAGSVSHDSHVTGPCNGGKVSSEDGDSSSKVHWFLMSKNLRSRLATLSQIIYKKENSEFVDCFNESSLWITSRLQSDS